MLALSLHQPWATLLAGGEKTIETRTWQNRYRGSVAIHATRSREFTYMRNVAMFHNALLSLEAAGHFHTWRAAHHAAPLCYSAIVGIGHLVAITPAEDVAPFLTLKEFAFGDYGEGRFAWSFKDLCLLTEPLPMPGQMGLWSPTPGQIIEIKRRLPAGYDSSLL